MRNGTRLRKHPKCKYLSRSLSKVMAAIKLARNNNVLKKEEDELLTGIILCLI
jgi:hypothetical protein